MTSSEATFTDAEVQKLTDDIIKAQVKEIAEMKEILERLEEQQSIIDKALSKLVNMVI